MMYLEILRASASLTLPAIALQHLPAEFPIGSRVQSNPRFPSHNRIHDTFGIRCKNSRLREMGSKV
jgi:hypothetical protein